jgi:argininosuccinate lyase
VRGKTGAPSAADRLARHDEGLPSGYNKDLQEDKEAVFDAEATLSARSMRRVPSCLASRSTRTARAAPRRVAPGDGRR